MVGVPGNTMNRARFRRRKRMDFERLSAQYSNMIHSIIHSLHIYKDHDDFYQIGLIALWNASENFDEEKGKFSTYAYSFIKGRILTHLKKEKSKRNAIYLHQKKTRRNWDMMFNSSKRKI